MGYLHIENLYRNQDIMRFRECYALEKVHGSSAHVKLKDGQITFFAGGETHERFVAVFDPALQTKMLGLGQPEVCVFGEVYGGRCQGMSDTYGTELRFIAFDVKIGDSWLSVPDAEKVVLDLGLEFVPYEKISTELAELDRVRDMPSEVAARRGCGVKEREGVVLRPLFEVTKNNGSRVISKHKGDKFNERSTPQKVVDPAKLKVLAEAQAIVDEWVTPMRLQHVLQKLPEAVDMRATPTVIRAMLEDVYREAKGEIVESQDASTAIARRAAELYKAHIKTIKVA